MMSPKRESTFCRNLPFGVTRDQNMILDIQTIKPIMALQPDFNQLAQNFRAAADQVELIAHLPAIAERQGLLTEFQQRDEQALARHQQLLDAIQASRQDILVRFDRMETRMAVK